jgi:hypothetical protein
MRYVLSGLTGATFVGIGSVLVYGPGSHLAHPWIEPLFWALIGAGAALSLLEGKVYCKVCTLRERLTDGARPCREDACLAR